MTNLNFLAGIIIVILFCVILAIRLVSINRRGGKITMEEFIDIYGDNIIKALKDVIEVLRINMEDYETQEEYEAAIVATTIDALKENSVEFGVPAEIVSLFDTDALTSIIITVFNQNKCDAMSILGSKTITDNALIMDSEVLGVVGITATEMDDEYDVEEEIEKISSEIDSELKECLADIEDAIKEAKE